MISIYIYICIYCIILPLGVMSCFGICFDCGGSRTSWSDSGAGRGAAHGGCAPESCADFDPCDLKTWRFYGISMG